MKLHLYLKHFPPHQTQFYEGTSKAVHGLAAGLAQHGIEVIVLCEGQSVGHFHSPAGYQVRCFAAPHTSPSFKLSRQLEQYVRYTLGPDDLVVLNGIFHRSLYALGKLLKRSQVPYIVAPHDPYHPSIFQKNGLFKQIYWHLCEKPTLQAAQAVQMLDDRHGQWLTNRGVTVPHFALPNGFEPGEASTAPANYDFDYAKPRFVFLGRIDAHNKGLDLLIQGFAHCPAAATASLTLQGKDCGDRATLQALAQQVGGDAIQFRAPDYQRTATSLLTEYDVFAVPSRFEGFSLAALEAMLAGRVIMISEVAGLAPYVAACGCGIVIPPTVQGVQQGITELMASRSRWAEMGAQGREYALTHLNWHSVARQAIAQYQSQRSQARSANQSVLQTVP